MPESHDPALARGEDRPPPVPNREAVVVAVAALVMLGVVTSAVVNASTQSSGGICAPGASNPMSFDNRTYCTATVTLSQLLAGYSAWGNVYHTWIEVNSVLVIPFEIGQPVRGASYGAVVCYRLCNVPSLFSVCAFGSSPFGPETCYTPENASFPVWFTPDGFAGMGITVPLGPDGYTKWTVMAEE